MTTDTAPRIIATEDRRYSMIAGADVIVVASQDDYQKDRRALTVGVSGSDGSVAIRVNDPTDRAAIFMGREAARLFAQAILDATA